MGRLYILSWPALEGLGTLFASLLLADGYKALSVKPSGFTEIPHKFLVAKRLSQCLNPVLPSGVHQKTLEVYSYVFSTLGVRYAE